MKKVWFASAAIAASILLCSGTKVNAQQLNAPAFPAPPRSSSALEARIAKEEVERIGLLIEWYPDSKVVRRADSKLVVLHQRLAQARPLHPQVSAQAQQKAIRAKIAYLETAHRSVARRRRSKQLDPKQGYVLNYLSVLRHRLVQLHTPPTTETTARRIKLL
jgi:hypothetical protein